MYQPIYDFFVILRDNLLDPLRQAISSSGIFNYFFNFFNAFFNGIFQTSDFNLTLGTAAFASLITLIVSIYCFRFVIKLFKNCFNFIINIFDDQFAFSGRRRRRKWNF